MTTSVDPDAGPSEGVTEPREMYVYRLRGPPWISPRGVLTETVTDPVPGGATASIRESDKTLKARAGVAPNLTPVAPVNPLPFSVTAVPPAERPAVGAMASGQ